MGLNTNPVAQRRLHLWATIAWAGITVPACLLIVLFREHDAAAIWTLVWLTFVSHYANFVGHWGAFQAAKVEVKQDEQISVQADVANVSANQANVRVSGDEGEA